MAKKDSWNDDTNYMQVIQDSVAAGDYITAAQAEQARNEKISSLGLDYAQTNDYSNWLNFGGSATGVGVNNSDQAAIRDQMNQNSIAWHGATPEQQASLHAQNQYLGNLLGGTVAFDENTGTWSGDAADVPLKQVVASGGGGFSYESAPTYTDKYTSQIEDILNGILTREEFSYDALNDPLYQQYKAQYQREGERAMKETLGQLSARTGGLASSYAATAAQQSSDYYASQIADVLPELYQLAYSMYLDDIDLQVQDMGLLQNMSDTQYNRYRDTMNDWRDDRNFAYGMYRDDVSDDKWAAEFNYGISRDQISDSRYDQEYSDSRSDLEYERNQLTKAEAQDRVNAYLAAFGSVSDLDSSILAASGYTHAELEALEKYYADQKAAANRPASGGSGSGKASEESVESTYDTIMAMETEAEVNRYLLDNKITGSRADGYWADWRKLHEGGINIEDVRQQLGLPNLTMVTLDELASLGAVDENSDGVVVWINGWNAKNYISKLAGARRLNDASIQGKVF